mgnify:CR=1 FL=1
MSGGYIHDIRTVYRTGKVGSRRYSKRVFDDVRTVVRTVTKNNNVRRRL